MKYVCFSVNFYVDYDSDDTEENAILNFLDNFDFNKLTVEDCEVFERGDKGDDE